MKRIPLIRIGLVIAIFPILIAFIASIFQGGSMFDEGSGTGAYLWLLIVTIPFGLFLAIVGLLVKIFRR
jgi:hypothetical protein